MGSDIWARGKLGCLSPTPASLPQKGKLMSQVMNGPEFTIPGAQAGPGGRRLLAAALVAASQDLVNINGALITRREALAHAIWNAILGGEIVFPDGRIMQIDDFDQWTGMVKWLHSHIDGPPVSLTDSRALNAVVRVVWEGDPDPSEITNLVAGPAIYNNGQ